ncbi:MAG: hypothetical protein BGO14_07090 [Chlamydiales bacterium 38-26]|nr:hypothetical protein [Chlamydiales bacterium]OJV10769.1 MAG: hypothetical protein BGO14_07090 [Chlamydiales bacterium 38-26]
MSSNTIEKVQVKDLKEYKAIFKEIKEKILTSQVKAILAVTHELINLYCKMSSKIDPKQKGESLQYRLWYTYKTIEDERIRYFLLYWLNNGPHMREENAITNSPPSVK